MRRVPTAVVFVVLAVAVWVLHPSISIAECKPTCHKDSKTGKMVCTVCGDFMANSEPDSTTALLSIKPSTIWGLAGAFSGPGLTFGIHPWGDKVAAWMETSLEKPNSAPKEQGKVLSVRATRAAADVFESGYAVSMKGPSEHPTFRVIVSEGNKMTWSGKHLPAGDVAVADEWPRFATAGSSGDGLPTVGWAYSGVRSIHLPAGSHAKMDTVVMGDRIRV